MSIYRMWVLNRETKKIDDWLIPIENSLADHETDKKLKLYDEVFQKFDIFLMDKLTAFWLIVCVYIKYAIVFMLLFSFISESIHDEGVAFLFASVVVIAYRKMDLNQLFGRYTEVKVNVLQNKTRILQEALKNIQNQNKEQ